jgi:gamma-glutamyltranspeptidase/glutathione hydrolase
VPVAATTVRAANGMVCAPDHLAASAGVAMLRAGGSPADAAVAASAVLAVTFQHACGMGGDLFALVYDGDAGGRGPDGGAGGRVSCLNASGRAGSGADPARLRADGLAAIPLRHHIAAVTVPGCVDGWVALHGRHGRLPLADVLASAIAYADHGFPSSPSLAGGVAAVADLPGAEGYRAAMPIRPGTLVRRPGVARALRAVVADGRDGFYGGEFGAGLVALGAGQFTPADLGRTQADWVEPLAVDAFGHRLWTTPPNSQGYLTLSSAWMADRLHLPDDPDDPSWAHLLIEASRQAAFDRLEVLSEDADGPALIDPTRLHPRLAAIDPDRAASLGDSYRAGGTIFLCAADGDGNGVSLIQSNAAGWGSLFVEPSTGIFLQNRGVGFSLAEGHPAEYGPARRPPHTLSPALVTTPGGDLRAVLGAMGGDSQPQIVLQLLARWLRGGAAPADAVDAGRFALAPSGPGSGFDTWNNRGRVAVQVEGHAPAAWHDGLRQRGHDVVRLPAYDSGFGWAQLIAVEPSGSLAGGTDPRTRSGGAVGW